MEKFLKRKENTRVTTEQLLPIIGIVLCFLTSKEIIPNYIYTIITLAFTVYFVPFRLLRFTRQTSKKSRLLFTIESLVFATIFAVAIALSYQQNSTFFKTWFLILMLFNLGLLINAYFTDRRESVHLHLLFWLFSAVVIV